MQIKICDPFPKQKWIRLRYYLPVYTPLLYVIVPVYSSLPLELTKGRRHKVCKGKLLSIPWADFLPGSSKPRMPEEVHLGK